MMLCLTTDTHMRNPTAVSLNCQRTCLITHVIQMMTCRLPNVFDESVLHV